MMLLMSCIAPPLDCDPAISCSCSTPTTCIQVSFTFTNLPTAGAVAQQVDLRASRPARTPRRWRRRRSSSKNLPSASRRLWIDAVRRPHAVQLRDVARRLGQHARRMHRLARRERLQRFDIGLQDAHVALGQPGDERRRCWNSSWLVAGRESIRMLRTPSCSMKRSDSSFAPEPIASMPITEPTPKTMPSAVSSVRVFCARRLATPGRYRRSGSFGERLHRAVLLIRRRRLGRLVGIGHRDHVAFVDARRARPGSRCAAPA